MYNGNVQDSMPRKRPVVKKNPEPTRIVEQYYIQAKSAEYVFCPANAIDSEFYHRDSYVIPEFVTTDGVAHRPTFIGTWNNRGGLYQDEFERICQRYYGTSFVAIRSIWIGRLDKLDDFWHLIKLD